MCPSSWHVVLRRRRLLVVGCCCCWFCFFFLLLQTINLRHFGTPKSSQPSPPLDTNSSKIWGTKRIPPGPTNVKGGWNCVDRDVKTTLKTMIWTKINHNHAWYAYCIGNVIIFSFKLFCLHCCLRTHRLRWWICFSTLQKTYINGIPLYKSTGKKYVIKSPIWDSLASTIFLRTCFSKKIFLQFGSYIYIYIYHFQL